MYTFESMLRKEVSNEITSSPVNFSYESLNPTDVAKPTEEKEYNVKCTLIDQNVLSTLGRYIDIEQWTIFIESTVNRPTKGSSRVRKETTDGNVMYTATDKLLIEKDGSIGYSHRTEHTLEITKEHFDTRKMLSDEGQIKRRYKLKCDLEGPFKGVDWIIDIFYTKDGQLSTACAIEMEVNSKIEEVSKQKIFVIVH